MIKIEEFDIKPVEVDELILDDIIDHKEEEEEIILDFEEGEIIDNLKDMQLELVD